MTYFDPTVETMSREQLRALQLDKLRAVFDQIHGRNRFYTAKLNDAGFAPGSLGSLDDLARLPFTTKRELVQAQADAPPIGTNATFPESAYSRLHQTSGTTGEPLRVVDTPGSWGCGRRGAGAAPERNSARRNIPIRATVHAGEPGANVPATKARIEAAWHAKCFDHAGASEIGAFSYECEAQPGGVHVIESEFIVEVLEPVTDRPVPPGEMGEMVITNLGRPGFPVLRYRSGDLVRLNTEPCTCGRTFMRFEGGVLGRADDMVVVGGVNVFPRGGENLIRKFDEVPELRV